MSDGSYSRIVSVDFYPASFDTGETINSGQVLGLCGNSGYSPTPQIYLQRQKGSSLAAETVSIKFSNVSIELNGELRFQEIGSLPQGALVTNVGVYE